MGISYVFANNELPFEYDQFYDSILVSVKKETLNECTFARGEFFDKQIPEPSKRRDGFRRELWRRLL